MKWIRARLISRGHTNMADATIAPDSSSFSTREHPDLLLRSFQPGDEDAFRALNEQWIAKYFRIEDKDRETLSDPVGKILHHGGHIYFAVLGEKTVGTCALIPTEPVVYEVARLAPASYEVAKMAVEESHRGAGIGRAVLEYTVAEAAKLGARRLYLETNDRLTNAIHLYETVGFRHLDPSRVKASPYARANVFMEMLL
jgi:putative acetyltransferase